MKGAERRGSVWRDLMKTAEAVGFFHLTAALQDVQLSFPLTTAWIFHLLSASGFCLSG